MKNEYEIRGEITVIFLKSQKYGDMETTISTSKLEKLKDFPTKWYPKKYEDTESFYVYGNTPLKNGIKKVVKLHRLLTDAPKGMVVDHINNKTLDNTDGNLRVVTVSENLQNRKGAQRNSKSGVRGVHWAKRERKWVAQIKLNTKGIRIGLYSTLEEAEKAVKEARSKYMPYSKEATT